MLYSTGAVKKDRVSWVLRREVCTWFVLQHALIRGMRATQSQGRWTSFRGNACLKTEKAASQPHKHTGQLKQTAGGAVPRPRLE